MIVAEEYNSIKNYNLKKENLIFWNSFLNNNQNIISLPTYIEIHFKEIRKIFLEFIYDFGKTKLNKKEIKKYLIKKNGINLWYMSLISEKNYFKSQNLYDCFKLIALEKILKKKKIREIKILNLDKKTTLCIKKMCFENKINFQIIEVKKNENYIKNFFYKLPFFFTVPAQILKFLSSHFFIILRKHRKIKKNNNSITFFSYLYDIKKNEETKEFYLSQWGNIPSVINLKKTNINWFHHYIKNDLIESDRKALKIIKHLNINSPNNANHNLLYQFLNFFLIFKAIKNFICFSISARKLSSISKSIENKKYYKSLWFMLKDDWEKSLFGWTSFENFLYIEIFNKISKILPKQKIILYLQENQGWEHALLKSLRSMGHKNIIGIAGSGSVVRNWDLNYFEDKRFYNSEIDVNNKYPDYIAVNSDSSKKVIESTSIDKKKIIKVEANRYFYLEKIKRMIKNKKENIGKTNVVVIGDSDKDISEKLIQNVKKISKHIGQKYNIYFRSHPYCKINLKKINCNFTDISNQSLNRLFIDNQIFIGSISTLILESLYLNKYTIMFLSGKNIPFKPVENFNQKFIAKDSNEILKLLLKYKKEAKTKIYKKYFYMSKDFKKWNNLFHFYMKHSR